MRIYGRKLGQVSVTNGTDKVVFDYPLPAGCLMRDLWVQMSMMATVQIDLLHASLYGVAGFVVPVVDPDAQLNVDTLWDNRVPKDVAESAGAFDLDTAAADVTPEFEVGEPDWGGVFGVAGNRPLEFFRRRRMITFPGAPLGHLEGTPDKYRPTDLWSTHVKRNIRADQHSHIMLGLSAPTMDVTTTTVPVTISETEWTMMTYMETVLEDAMKQLMGLIESGAETPYEEAAAFVARLIEKVAFEETAASFQPTDWIAFTKATIGVDVPGKIAIGALTSE